MLAMSSLFRDILTGVYKCRLTTPYETYIGGTVRYIPYLLADGIYPNWPIFVKPLHHPGNYDEAYFTKRQEDVRKDIERFFGVLQARFCVLRS